MDLLGKTAVITGGGGGIGRAIATSLAKEGVNVILFGGNNIEKLIETKKQVLSFGTKCFVFPFDLTDDSALLNTFNDMTKTVSGFDFLINNAGMTYSGNVESTPIEVFDKVMKINVRVPYLLTQLSLPILRKSQTASIINVASVVAHSGYPLQSAYVASKHALLGFTKSLANEVYQDGIRVHAISPGGVFTDMVRISRPDLTGDNMTLPEEIADIVLFLLKNRTNAVVDEIIVHRPNKPPFLV